MIVNWQRAKDFYPCSSKVRFNYLVMHFFWDGKWNLFCTHFIFLADIHKLKSWSSTVLETQTLDIFTILHLLMTWICLGLDCLQLERCLCRLLLCTKSIESTFLVYSSHLGFAIGRLNRQYLPFQRNQFSLAVFASRTVLWSKWIGIDWNLFGYGSRSDLDW